MLRLIVLACMVLILVGGGSVYAQTTKTVKVKPPKKVKVQKVKKPPKLPATALTPDETAIRKANEKSIRERKKAFEKPRKQ